MAQAVEPRALYQSCLGRRWTNTALNYLHDSQAQGFVRTNLVHGTEYRSLIARVLRRGDRACCVRCCWIQFLTVLFVAWEGNHSFPCPSFWPYFSSTVLWRCKASGESPLMKIFLFFFLFIPSLSSACNASCYWEVLLLSRLTRQHLVLFWDSCNRTLWIPLSDSTLLVRLRKPTEQ